MEINLALPIAGAVAASYLSNPITRTIEVQFKAGERVMGELRTSDAFLAKRLLLKLAAEFGNPAKIEVTIYGGSTRYSDWKEFMKGTNLIQGGNTMGAIPLG